MDAHDQIDNEPDIEFDEETYEIKAIKAYIAKEISSIDLQVSLELGRAQTFRRVERYKRLGAAGLESGKTEIANAPVQNWSARGSLGSSARSLSTLARRLPPKSSKRTMGFSLSQRRFAAG